MSFLVFEQATGDDGIEYLRPTGQQFKLAGDNLLRQAWVQRGKPLNQGWHVSQAELVDLHFGETSRPRHPRLVFDFHPGSMHRIGIVQPTDVHAYTFGDNDRVEFTPLMIKIVDVFYKEYDTSFTVDERRKVVSSIPLNCPPNEAVEFIYLKGDWKFGRTGGVNAAFIGQGARDYFRQFF